MFNQTFGHNLLRKYVIYFGTLFNNVWLQRFDLNDTLVQRSKVPLNYGPRDKFLARREGNEDLNRPIAIQLPRMAFELVDLQYDASRKLNSLNKLKVPNANSPSGYAYQYSPVPYNLVFRLSIMTKNVLDGTYIVEQILPYFGPTWQATLNINPELGIKYDIPITLNDVTQEDTYEGYFEQRRAIIWTLTFTMKAWMFGPTIIADSGIIKNIELNLRVPPSPISIDDANPSNSVHVLKTTITPGVDLNDLPVNSSFREYVYTISNTVGSFMPTERIINSSDPNKFAFVKTANSTQIVSLTQTADFVANTQILGLTTDSTAIITNVKINPEVQSWSNVSINSDFGFIHDIMENL